MNPSFREVIWQFGAYVGLSEVGSPRGPTRGNLKKRIFTYAKRAGVGYTAGKVFLAR
jgi:hypothetical protein